MRILNLATQVKYDGHEASRRHAFAIAHGMADLINTEVILAVGGRQAVDINDGQVKIYVRRFTSLIDDVGLITKIWRAISNNTTAAFKLRKIFTNQPDVIYERHSIGSFIGIGFAIIMRKPLVFEVNGVPDEEVVIDLGIRNKLLQQMLFISTKKHLNYAKAIITQSDELKNALKQRYNCNNIYVVPNGADQVTAGNTSTHNIPKICFIGTLDAMHDLSEVLSVLHAMKHDFVLFIVGDGRNKSVYQNNYKFDERFQFLGRLSHNQAMEVLAACDLAIAVYGKSYPLFEKYGFYFSPMKLFEYLAYAKPCVYIGPTNSMIRSVEQSGAITVLKDSKKLKSALIALLNRREALAEMSVCAKTISKDFTWIKSAQSTRNILESVINL